MIVKVPLRSGKSDFLPTCDGQKANYKIRKDFGHDWLFIVVPEGSHTVKT
jgi:hypothetical protein